MNQWQLSSKKVLLSIANSTSISVWVDQNIGTNGDRCRRAVKCKKWHSGNRSTRRLMAKAVNASSSACGWCYIAFQQSCPNVDSQSTFVRSEHHQVPVRFQSFIAVFILFCSTVAADAASDLHDTSEVSRGFRTRPVAQNSATKEVYKRCVCTDFNMTIYIYSHSISDEVEHWIGRLTWVSYAFWPSLHCRLFCISKLKLLAQVVCRHLKQCKGARVQMPNANVWTTVFKWSTQCTTTKTYSGDAYQYELEKVLLLALIFRLKCMRSSFKSALESELKLGDAQTER